MSTKTDPDWVKNWMDNLEQVAPDQKETLEEIRAPFVPRAPLSLSLGPDFIDSDGLRVIGVECGNGCFVHRTVQIPFPHRVHLGDHVRIDAFTILSTGPLGDITIGDYVHISSSVLFIASAGIVLGNYAQVAAGCKLFSASDDFSGEGLVGPMVPVWTRVIRRGLVVMGDFAVMGANSILMPGSTMCMGSMVLANSVVTKCVDAFCIYGGQPASLIRHRSRGFLKFLGPDGVRPRLHPEEAQP